MSDAATPRAFAASRQISSRLTLAQRLGVEARFIFAPTDIPREEPSSGSGTDRGVIAPVLHDVRAVFKTTLPVP